MAFVPDQPGAAPAGGFVPDTTPAASPAPVTGTSEGGGLLSYMASPRAPAEAIATLGTGLVGQAVGGYAGLAAAALPGEAGQGARVAERVSSALTYEPRTKAGGALVSAAQVPGELFSKHIAKPLGERGARVSPALGAVGETAAEAVPILLGARAGMKSAKPLTAAEQRVAEARDQGFKMTPEEMGAGPVARGAAGLAGEPRLAKANSRENAALGTQKAKADLGIKPDAPLDLETLAAIRKQDGKAYESVRNAGEIDVGPQYLAAVDQIGAQYRSAAKDFPEAAKLIGLKDVEQVISALKREPPEVLSLRVQAAELRASGNARYAQAIEKAADEAASRLTPKSFDADSAVSLVSKLRDKANDLFTSTNAADKGMAKVFRAGAQVLDDQILTHLKATGREAQYADYIAARERIAKTYAVEKALVGDTVNPQALGRQVQARKPLTGGLKETGEFAREFERSSQKPTHMPTGATVHDLALGMLHGLRTQGGSLALDAITAGARPVVRSALSSRPGQWAMDPRTNLSGPAMEAIGASTAITPRKEKR